MRKSIAAITLAAMALIILVWTVVWERVRYEETRAVREVERHNANLALAFRENTLRTIRSVDQLLQLVLREKRGHRELDLGELVSAGQIDYGLVSSVAIVDRHGVVVAADRGFVEADLSDREYFVHHRDADKGVLHVGAPVAHSRLTGRSIIPLSRRISSAEGGFEGIVIAGVEPRLFTDFYRQMAIGKDGMAILVGLDGISRARHAGIKDTSGEDMRGSTLLRRQGRQPNGSFLSMGKLEGVARYTSYQTLPEYGLVIAVGTSRAELLADLNERRDRYFVAAGMFTVLLVVCAALGIKVLRRREIARLQAQRQEARFRATFDQDAVAIAQISPDGHIMSANRKMGDLLGYAGDELLRRSVADLADPDDLAKTQAVFASLTESGASTVFEIRCRRRNGEKLWASIGLSLVRDPSAREPAYFIALMQDITVQKETEKQLDHMAHHDVLTGLPNRSLFHDRLHQVLNQAKREHWIVGVMFIDLDKFKQVNDTMGHDAGDALLKEIGARLSRSVRSSDTAARVGGDEFAVVLARMTRWQDASVVAEKILDEMSRPMQLEGRDYAITVSIGIALFPQDGTDAETLVHEADEAMFRAKQAGRNAFRLHEARGDHVPIQAQREVSQAEAARSSSPV